VILLFISAILVSFSGILFSLNFSVQGLNRAVINTPIELMYRTVSYKEDILLFEKDKLKKDLNTYYDKVLPRYCDDYKVEYYFYNKNDDSMCLSDRCNSVEISINCKLILNYTFYRVMYYEMKGRING